MKVVVAGAGAHFTSQHGPALKHFSARHPGKIELAAVCDMRAERAENACRDFGFQASFTSVEEMLAEVDPQAAFAVLPGRGTLETLEQFMKRGIPLVMEKPLGADIEEAGSIESAAKRWNAQVMVSLNRRFDPGLSAAREWLKDKGPIRYLVGSMLRVNRTERDFIWGTGVHLLDAMVALAGPLRLASKKDVHRCGDYGCAATLHGDGGLVAMVEILPVCGREEERLRAVTDEACVDVWTGWIQPWSVRGYAGSKSVLEQNGPPGDELDLRNGTYHETEAFLLAVLEGRELPMPSVSDAMIATGLADDLMRAR